MQQMNEEFAKKESWYVAELGKKTNLIGLYKDENAAKELRIKNLEKRLAKLQKTGAGPAQKMTAEVAHMSTQTQPKPAQQSPEPLEISLVNPRNLSNIKNTLLANFPETEFEKSAEFQNAPSTQAYDKNLEKSSARLEVISKQEQILLNLNKHLNEDSGIFSEQAPPQEALTSAPKAPEELGISLKKFSAKLMNVIEMNNRVLKVG